MIKVVDSQGSNSKTTTTIELDVDAPPKVLEKIRQDVGDYLVESVLSEVAEGRSPVSGESFPALNREYKKIKVAQGGQPIPNLELSGGMLSSLEYRGSGNKIEIGVWGDEAGKFDGHNNFSGDSALPKRRALPAEGQHFKASIEAEVEKIVADNLAEAIDIKKSDLEDVSTKQELYDLLGEQFESMTRIEIRAAVLRSAELTELLDDMDLLDLL